MSYRLIEGEFHLFYRRQRHVGSRPDGDSVWFKPTKPNLLRDDPDRDDDLWIIPTAEFGNLHDVVSVSASNRIAMTYFPEELVIVPR